MAARDLAVLLRNCTHASGATNSSADVTNAANQRYALKCDSFAVQLAKTPIQIPVPQQSPELIDLGIFRPSISIGGLVDNIGQDPTNVPYAVGTAAQSASTVQGYNSTGWTADMVGSTINLTGGGGLISAVNVGTQQFTVSTSATVGATTYTITTGFENMEHLNVSRRYYVDNSTYSTKTNRYYIPYKNILEEITYKWIATDTSGSQLELEIGDADYPIYNRSAEPNTVGGTAISGTNNETGGGIYIVALQQARFQVDPGTEDRWTFQMQFVCESRKDVQF